MAQAPNPRPWGEAGDPECRRAGGLDGPARRALGAAAGSLFRGWVRFALLLEEILSRSRGISRKLTKMQQTTNIFVQQNLLYTHP